MTSGTQCFMDPALVPALTTATKPTERMPTDVSV
jgi:hypothetical protein